MGIEATAVPLGTQTQQGLQCNGEVDHIFQTVSHTLTGTYFFKFNC